MPTSYTIIWPWLTDEYCNNSLSVSPQKTLIWTFRFLPNKLSWVHCTHNRCWRGSLHSSSEMFSASWSAEMHVFFRIISKSPKCKNNLQVVFAFSQQCPLHLMQHNWETSSNREKYGIFSSLWSKSMARFTTYHISESPVYKVWSYQAASRI